MFNLRLFPLLLILILQFSVYTVHCRLCYLTGKVRLPKDVNPPSDVNCLRTTIFANIPDLQFSNTKFSMINFKNSALTPAGFALASFSAGGAHTTESIVTAGKLYSAANAALLDRGEKKIQNQLQVQIEATKGPDGRDSTIGILNKLIKICGPNCTSAEIAKIQDMIAAMSTV
ncbi:hypothetical protein H4Q26_004335 [Puccinia striiformis f. sp. tritici PST-130]|nr:hypothetical protein H4Q26_004335 [Puccinia striiformis f. sp. tritici PST-130]